ncbi:MAG: family 20 glycosylhydrolase [Lentisphaeria bacterium]|nr:family 20 glycosylhydrolase [Lentisphaeria bacterium]
MLQKPILLPIPKKMSFGDKCVSNEVFSNEITFESNSDLPSEGYLLVVNAEGIKITYADEAGKFYARQTLQQLQMQYQNNDCPILEIEDYPDIAIRGVSLDVSRDRIPPFEDLLKFVDLLASWKINTFSLYFEHVFAYKNHEIFWKNASPFTAEDIKKLDNYCKERFIDLIPAQETLGHLARILCHEPYRQLAECPEGFSAMWQLRESDPFSLCPTDPKSLEFMEELLDELLPNFSSEYFLCGGDETADVGIGRSKDICDKIGKDKVYADYFREISRIAKKHGKKIIIYADMVKNNSTACNYLPKDIILAEWGYERNYPFAKNAKTFIDSDLRFFFLSSNNNFYTLGGRTYRWRGNIANAVKSAIELNALGVFNHEFGDFGHWTQFSFSLPGFAYGAAVSWNFKDNEKMDIASALDLFAYEKCENTADLIMDIGKIYLHTSESNDADSLFYLFYRGMFGAENVSKAELADRLAKAEEDLISCTYRLQKLRNCPERVRQEIAAALQYISFAIHTAKELVQRDDVVKVCELPFEIQKDLTEEFCSVIDSLLKIRDKYYLIGGRHEAILYLKRYWETCFNQIKFPKKYLSDKL